MLHLSVTASGHKFLSIISETEFLARSRPSGTNLCSSVWVPRSDAAMKTLSPLCLLFLLLCCVTGPARSRTLLLNSCSVNVNLEELCKYYYSIRLSAVSEHPNGSTSSQESHLILTGCGLFLKLQITGDDEIGVKLLDKSLIEDVQVRFFCFGFFFLTFPIQIVEMEQGTEAPSAPTLWKASILVKSTRAPASEAARARVRAPVQHLSLPLRTVRDAVSCASCCVST